MPIPVSMHSPIDKTPPIIASGIVAKTAPNFVKIPIKIKISDAICMVNRLATRVIATAAIFSEYVVTPVPTPSSPARHAPIPNFNQLMGEG